MNPLAQWSNFYVAVAGASAALTGLIFVGVSISLAKILSIPSLPNRALVSLILLLNVLVVSLLFLVPIESLNVLGLRVLIIELAVWVILLLLDIRSFKSKEKKHKWLYAIIMLIDQVAMLLFTVTGVLMTIGQPNAVYLMVTAIILSIVKAVVDGWVLLVEINR